MSHRIARDLIAKNKARLAKHFAAQEPEWELDKETVQRLQREIEQAEQHLNEADDEHESSWPDGDIYG